MKPRILHCDLDAFFASVECVLHPELKGKPLIVGGDPKTRGIVACPSYEARALGVQTAMSLKEAYRRAPHAVFLKGSFAHYRSFSERFFRLIAEYSDCIEPLSLDEAFLDLSPIANWKTVEEIAEEIRQRIRGELGLSVSIGVGTNKTVAKIASEYRKPNGITVVLPGQEEQFLAPLPVKAMPGIGKQTQRFLQRQCIATLGQLAKLPESRLLRLFGWRGSIFRDRARGIDERRVHAHRDRAKSVGHSRTFTHDISDDRFLLATASYLLEKAAMRLRKHDAYASVVKLTIRYSDFTTQSMQVRLRNPTDNQQLFSQKMVRLYAKLRKPQRVRLIGVSLAGMVPNPHQRSFSFSHLLKMQKIQRAVDTLRSEFGFDAVLTGRSFPMRRSLLLHER